MDYEAYRVDSRRRWEGAASGWDERREAVRSAAAPVAQWIVDAADPQPGETIVEVACGLGDTGLLAARRVGPAGRVILTDGAPAMVEAAGRAIAATGADHVEARAMEAEWLDLETASADAILSRWGYMLLADPEAALREARRVLRPGGRIALAVWAPQSENPWIGVLQEQLLARGLATIPEPGTPGMFALADQTALTELLWAAGFSDVRLERVPFAWEAPDVDAWWEHMRVTSISLGETLQGLAPAEHYALRDAVDAAYAQYARPNGSLQLPACALGAFALA
ncbi:unannotated protein [freshwater metagenome]|uniref:Unannotated protein n=1 Tax=freshwater metagenome TaxID=449393 RepID=A0A6J7DWY0_9ZZZZ|nr:methyltransferase domain-containing protein [Actinomycetota bacterium]